MSLGGGHRLLHDKGARWAVVGLGVVLAVFAIVGARSRDRARTQTALTGGMLDVQVFCGGRGRKDAVALLRPPLQGEPQRVGTPISTAVANRGGSMTLALPSVVAPDFAGELLAAAPGCLTQRLVIGNFPREYTLRLDQPTPLAWPVDLRDPPLTPRWPPVLAAEHAARLREVGAYSPQGFQLFDSGAVPTCVQCHQAAGREHAQVHGAAPSADLTRLMASSPGPSSQARCAACHAPAQWLANPLSHQAPTAEDFSCRICHQLKVGEARNATPGVGPWMQALGAGTDPRPFAFGSRGLTASPAMAVAQDPSLAEGVLCLACHGQKMPTVQGGWTEADPTAMEHRAWVDLDFSRARTTCVGCHMPATPDVMLVDGMAAQMWGVARPDAPRKAHARSQPRGASLSLRQAGGVWSVVNTEASHSLPGPWPWRAWTLLVRSDAGDPLGRVMLARRYKDVEGGPCGLPWDNTGLLEDTRIPPGNSVALPGVPVGGGFAVELWLEPLCSSARRPRVLRRWQVRADGTVAADGGIDIRVDAGPG